MKEKLLLNAVAVEVELSGLLRCLPFPNHDVQTNITSVEPDVPTVFARAC
jgi:hypothetical protein